MVTISSPFECFNFSGDWEKKNWKYLMSKTLMLRECRIHLIGSVHSTTQCIPALEVTRPSHFFVECSRDILALVRRNVEHSSTLKDLPALIRYADEKHLPVQAVDTTAGDIASRIFSELPTSAKFKIWRYVVLKLALSPIADYSFQAALRKEQSWLDDLTTRWSVSPYLLRRSREIISAGGTEKDIERLMESTQDITTFISSHESDPTEYIQLCQETGIDRLLQENIINYRNDYMCHQLRRLIKTIRPNSVCAVIVGKNHVDGMFENLSMGDDYVPSTLCSTPISLRKPRWLDQILLASLVHS
jgi:pheromone shutdown protein TraB